MKITKRELKQMINESVRDVLNESKINYNSTIQTLLKKYKIDYHTDDSFSKSIYYKIDDENGLNVEFSVIKDDYVEPERIPRCFYTSSSADGAKCVLKILHWSDYTNEFFDKPSYNSTNKDVMLELCEKGYREANGYHCPQWGTWKYIINTKKELTDIIKTISKYYNPNF